MADFAGPKVAAVVPQYIVCCWEQIDTPLPAVPSSIPYSVWCGERRIEWCLVDTFQRALKREIAANTANVPCTNAEATGKKLTILGAGFDLLCPPLAGKTLEQAIHVTDTVGSVAVVTHAEIKSASEIEATIDVMACRPGKKCVTIDCATGYGNVTFLRAINDINSVSPGSYAFGAVTVQGTCDKMLMTMTTSGTNVRFDTSCLNIFNVGCIQSLSETQDSFTTTGGTTNIASYIMKGTSTPGTQMMSEYLGEPIANNLVTQDKSAQNKPLPLDIDVDLNSDGKFTEDDPDEHTNPGKVVCENDDHDNGDNSKDDNADGVINGDEDKKDMAILKIRKINAELPAGSKLILKVSDKGIVRIFDHQGTARLGQNPPDADSYEIPLNLMSGENGSDRDWLVEGVKPGTVTITLEYDGPLNPAPVPDRIKVTVDDVKITSVDANFAPSAEKFDVKYTIYPSGFTSKFAKIEIFMSGDTNNPIFKDEGISKSGTDVLYQWDGRANQGAGSGKFVSSKDSPFTVKVSISNNASFAPLCSAQEDTKVEIESITLNPAGNESVIKPNRAATEIDKEIEALVKIKKKDGSGVIVPIPLKIDWSFEDPDDTAEDAGIDMFRDPDDNAPVANGGKRGANTIMWKAIAGFTTSVAASGQSADTETKTADADNGKAKIIFSTSAIGADNYILVAQYKSATGAVLKDKKSGTWSVRKKLNFANAYQLNGGIDVAVMMSVDNIDPAFSGDGYTDYTLGAVTALAAGANSPEFIAPLLSPNAAETPTAAEIAALDAVFPADVDALPTGNFPGAEDTDYDRDGVFDPAGQPDDVTRDMAKSAIKSKAQSWVDRNEESLVPSLMALATTIGATTPSAIGARHYHPKLDDNEDTGRTDYYPDGIFVTVGSDDDVDPDGEWRSVQGAELLDIAYVFLNSDNAARRQIIGRHEAGHASDHELFGIITDHWISGLMRADGDGNTFSDDSIKRLSGWKR